MSRSAATAANHGTSPALPRRTGLPMSATDRKQAELFAELLGKHRKQVAQDMCSTTAAIAHHRDIGDSLTSHRLRQTLQHMSRRQSELDQLCDQLHRRLAAAPREITEFPKHFDIIVTRRRAGWRLTIPRFNVTLANIDSRGEAETIGRSLIAAVTGFPPTGIVVRSLVG